jgi:hypothetical protein
MPILLASIPGVLRSLCLGGFQLDPEHLGVKILDGSGQTPRLHL